MPIFTFPISQWKLKVAIATKYMSNHNKKKHHHFVEAYVMNMFAKFQLYPPYGFFGIFKYIFHKFNISVAMKPTKFRGLD